MRKCRPWPYEELVHIPLVIRHPDGMKGRVSSFAQTVDIAPTIMDFLGVTSKTDRMQGKSLLPLMRGDVEKVRDFAISGYFNFSWSIITDDLSYIERAKVVEVLRREKGNKTRAAQSLRIDRRKLYRLIEKYGIQDSELSEGSPHR